MKGHNITWTYQQKQNRKKHCIMPNLDAISFPI